MSLSAIATTVIMD